MTRRAAIAMGLLFLSMVVGCHNRRGELTMAGPDLFHPRSADIQQKRALRYDPFPDPNVGADMTGTRPREYVAPLTEASRARWHFKWDSHEKKERWRTDGNELDQMTPVPAGSLGL